MKVTSSRRSVLELPEDVRPDEAVSVTSLGQPPVRGLATALLQIDMEWPAGLAIHRKDLYGDSGR